MLKRLKRIGLSLLVVIVLLAIWIHIGSIDQETFDDRGLLSQLKQVPDAENGFLDIAYMGEDGFKFSGVKDNDSLKDISVGKKWSLYVAESLVKENKPALEAIRKSNQKKYFKFPEVHGMLDNLFNYQEITKANRILIVESRLYANNFEYDKAIQSINDALIFSEHIRSEESGYMISWAIGLVMQGEILSWVHELLSVHDLSYGQYVEITATMKRIRPYNDDGFGKVLIGEMKFAVGIVKEVNSKPVRERFSDYFEMEDVISKWSFFNPLTFKERLFEYANLLFPQFYVHENHVNNVLAKSLEDEISNVGQYCFSRVSPALKNIDYFYAWRGDMAWSDLIKPNAHGNYLSKQGVDNYYSYYQRRCLFHVYADAVKTVVAIKAYGKQHGGALPEKLDVLVPNYLDKLPIDYFTGEILRYSPEKQWLYSVGADYKDDGGSMEGFYQGRCKEEEACFNNPTVPLFTPPLPTEKAAEDCKQ